MEDFGAHATFAAVAVWIIQQIKASKSFPWITIETDRLNRWISIVAAFASGLGVDFSPVEWNPVTHGLTLGITGLDPYTITVGLWGVFQTFVWQQLWYHGLIKKE